MTREQIKAIEQLYLERSDSLDASSYSIPELCKDALEAVELREALEWIWKQPQHHTMNMELIGGKYRVTIRKQIRTLANQFAVSEGSTPLEAINNARRGM